MFVCLFVGRIARSLCVFVNRVQRLHKDPHLVDNNSQILNMMCLACDVNFKAVIKFPGGDWRTLNEKAKPRTCVWQKTEERMRILIHSKSKSWSGSFYWNI